MKTYQRVITSILLSASLIFGCGKNNTTKSFKLMPSGEYSRFFKNAGSIKSSDVIEEVHPRFGFGITLPEPEHDRGFLVFTIYNMDGKQPYIMDLRSLGDSEYKCIGLVEKLPQRPVYCDPFFPIIPRDMDNDGDLDLLVAWPAENLEQKVNYFENIKQCKYIDRGIIANFNKTYKTAKVDLIVVDYDGDKDLDLILTDNIQIEENKGILIENNLPQKNLK